MTNKIHKNPNNNYNNLTNPKKTVDLVLFIPIANQQKNR